MATTETLTLPKIPPSDYLARFINDLLTYAGSDVDGENAEDRIVSRVRAKQAARIIATFCSPVGGYGASPASVPPEPPTLMTDEHVADLRRLAEAGYDLTPTGTIAFCDTVAALRAEVAALTLRLGTALCELGAPDPRLASLKGIRVDEVPPENHAFAATPRPLTLAEAESVVRAARSASGEDRHGD